MIEYRMPTEQEIINNEFIGISISKDEVIHKDFIRIDYLVRMLRKLETKARGKLMITFEGYENSGEAYMIPEIRKYINQLYEDNKELFYYIYTGEGSTLQFMILCLLQVNIINDLGNRKKVAIDAGENSRKIITGIVKNMQQYVEKIDDRDIINLKNHLSEIKRCLNI